MARIEGHIDAACLQGADDTGDHPRVVVEQQCYPRSVFIELRPEASGDAVCRCSERGVGPLPSLLPDGDALRVSLSQMSEALRKALLDLVPFERRCGPDRPRLAAVMERAAALGGREDGQGGDALL